QVLAHRRDLFGRQFEARQPLQVRHRRVVEFHGRHATTVRHAVGLAVHHGRRLPMAYNTTTNTSDGNSAATRRRLMSSRPRPRAMIISPPTPLTRSTRGSVAGSGIRLANSPAASE